MPDTIHQYEPLWGSWYIDTLLGEGSFGKVYKIRKEEFEKTYFSAVKIISVPQSDTEVRQAQMEGLQDASLRSYFHAQVTDILQEIDLMSGMRGNSHIVSYEDHKVIEKSEGFGWDILIRMELLTSLHERVVEKPLAVEDVVRLGVDICRALELCTQQQIIHRDIKPENIFVSSHGDYKLGDFGIARQIERSMSGLSKKGTYTYMAPEVFKGEEYGSSVDTYSLGLVMYRLLNHNRTPFLPDYPNPIMPREREEAQQRRMRGEPIPLPKKGSAALQAVVLRACAYDRKARFGSAAEMREVLEEATGQVSGTTPSDVYAYATDVHESAEDVSESTAGVFADASRAEIAADCEHTSAATVGVFTANPRSEPRPATDALHVPPTGPQKKAHWVPWVAVGAIVLIVWLSGRPPEGVSTLPLATAAVTRVPTQQPTLGVTATPRPPTPSPSPKPQATATKISASTSKVIFPSKVLTPPSFSEEFLGNCHLEITIPTDSIEKGKTYSSYIIKWTPSEDVSQYWLGLNQYVNQHWQRLTPGWVGEGYVDIKNGKGGKEKVRLKNMAVFDGITLDGSVSGYDFAEYVNEAKGDAIYLYILVLSDIYGYTNLMITIPIK